MDIADLYHEAQEKYEEEQRSAWFAAQDDEEDPFTGDFVSFLWNVSEPFMSFADFCETVEQEEIDRDLDRRYPNL